MLCTLCPEKKRPKLGQFRWNLVYCFLNKFVAKWLNVFHLTWIMSLHYLVKLQMPLVHTLQLSCYKKKLQNLSHLNCVLQLCQIWIQLITACGKYCNRRCAKHASLIRSYQWWTTNGCRNDNMIQLGTHCSQSLFQFVHISDGCFVHLLFQYSSHTVINWIQNWQIWGPRLRWNTF